MDILILCIALLSLIGGVIGSFIPVLPGPPLSWLGILLLFLAPSIPFHFLTVIITFIIAAIIFAMDFIIPAIGTKKFGGTKYGMYGSTIGLIMGVFFPIPFIGIFSGAFLGALIGEMIAKNKYAFKAAIGSLIGLIASSFIKFILALIYLILFLKIVWDYQDVLTF